jgi:RHH-type proline utilization regulon transcriptional repressor/proline dehydrogenase/delta 1-pyrroline-5-carboxylate dehydrogenase
LADDEVTALARRLAERSGGAKGSVFEQGFLSSQVMGWALSHPSFRTQLFRFVDVFPATAGDDHEVLRHLEEYFGDAVEMPKLLDLGLDVAEHVPFGAAVSAGIARRNIRRMAEQFILGSTTDEAVARARQLWRAGIATTVDLLGEKTTTPAQADRYAARVRSMLDGLLASGLPSPNVSVKPTALAPHFASLTRAEGLEEAIERLAPILAVAEAGGAHIHLDMEHLDVKDLTFELLQQCADAHPDLSIGIVVQAYLKDALDDLTDLLAWAVERPTPITVRLVKGAYWDTETVVAAAEGWPVPVFERKVETDASYERGVDLLLATGGRVKAAFASHNLRTIAYAVTSARRAGLDASAWEVQMLHGMARPLQEAVRAEGLPLRLYAPVGELVPGMAYLVRRLLENTSNESFLAGSALGRDLDEQLAPPVVESLPRLPDERRLDAHDSPATDAAAPGAFVHEPHAEFRRRAVRDRFGGAIAGTGLGRHYPVMIAGEFQRTADEIVSVDPSRPSMLIGVAGAATPAIADAAVAAGLRAQPAWARRPVEERARYLFEIAARLRARRFEIAALEVFECGKPWKEADADVCEAIDFCEYYGREAVRLARGGVVQSPPGEQNSLRYEGLGVGVVIAPWNFPLAIPLGMAAAALVAGNAVILKPAEQAPAVAFHLQLAAYEVGLPDGVFTTLAGRGEVVGRHLVTHPDISFVAFTGSSAVGLEIVREAAVHQPGQRFVRRVVAEMGGKNAIVVDADADLDAAVPDIVASAFGYAGQKCSAASRVVVLDSVADELVERLVGAASILRIGPAARMGTQLGPLIDEDALEKVRRYAAVPAGDGQVVLDGLPVPEEGWFHSPVIVDRARPDSAVVRDEVFGPVLAIQRAADLDEALALANATDFALTAGIFSRSPAHIRRAAAELRAGNVYVNRAITGAVVGRQPFGGWGLSGVGSKAGGPDYLLQFMRPRVVTENTLRQGFAPPTTGGT